MRRKFLLLLEMGLILAGLALGWGAWKVYTVLEQPLHVTQERLLDVPSGTTPNRMFYRMQGEGLLEDALWLRLYWRFNMAGTPLHTGEYRLTPGMTVHDLFEAWRRGDVVQYNLTLVEGWTFRQVRAAVAKHEKIKHTLGGLSDSEVMDRLGHTGVFPEGRFFPDTYRFVRGMSDVELLQQAYMRLEEVLAKEWAARASGLPYRDPYQALIMASLVEKETGIPQERGQIAGVFVRRLRLGMMLQTDPTVIYGMGERYNGRITRADLREPTPYNTYTMTGLPPTPIAMVGREAIHAALNPADGSSLYFVARGDGSHVFSDDLDDHNTAVREYQLKRRADYRSSPAPQAQPEEGGQVAPSEPPAETGEPPATGPADAGDEPATESAPAEPPAPDEQQ
ncbi:endolytic transglycosylase MltG [Pseudomonas guariconensis]|uniref:endolytic transglycosylase MltG n=1 Tax=Pseudomonas TaxID=286 RepID=UPI001CE493C4|nr:MULTISPECIES: endolytic transglycosylase MltG [Pseudomonas]MCO7641176.1 endolytic transglycosylase MltG [Pseudomonas sp. S 311-6]MCO7514871.1 endolytic transglycosylase MltG [Pseudomonas putida]MCO7565821.1 endolytic transglycosylase MltG [Pseudomonas mosselii]MCO7605278.1 endolytic transglycosylase MltG [Pseudomonas guariconensis]MCO7616827.1 endolytic transglycosylase MltG [Pseudomonas guariconensis]